MTETERIDGRIRDLAELCTRHGTPCADGLLAEIGRLRIELADAERVRQDYEDERDEARAELAALGEPITEYGSPSMCFNGQETTNWGDRYWVGATLGRTVRRGPEWTVDHDFERAALDQRFTQ